MKRCLGRYFLLGVVLGASILGACSSDEITGERKANQAPTVWLSAAPPEGSVGTYTVHLYWGGWDPDGEIGFYEYLITDNVTGVFNPADTTNAAWMPVVANDSTFVFSADSLTGSTTGQRSVFTRSHTFFVRSVDREGLRSKEPAHRSFTSRTLSPEVTIKVPRADLGITPASIPAISTLQWVATDYVDDLISTQEPDSVQWALVSTRGFNGSYAQAISYLRSSASDTAWYPWSWYRAPNDSGKFWTTPPLAVGGYVFAVRAKDEAGAVTPVLEEPVNVRRLSVTQRTSGPVLVCSSILIGAVTAATCDYPLTIVDVPSGVPISFTLSACAEHYGGTVAGYRYGWDIPDLNDPTQWEIDYTPFVGSSAVTPARTFSFGTHTFTSEVIDNSGYCSRVEIKINVIRFSGDRNLLLVDDFAPDLDPIQSGWDRTLGGMPNDAEHDSFWLDMLSNLRGFDPRIDMITPATDVEIPLTTLAGYKSIIWSVYGKVDTPLGNSMPALYTYVQYRTKRPPPPAPGGCSQSGGGTRVIPNYVGLAMQAGVHVLMAGMQPVQHVRNRSGGYPNVKWPVIPLYEFEPGRVQTGAPREADLSDPPGDQGFAFRELCLEAIDYGLLGTDRARLRGNREPYRYCPVTTRTSLRDHTMRGGTSADPNFPSITLRPEAAGPGRQFAPEVQGIDVEVYNPAYFQIPRCTYVPSPRSCFQPIYTLDCLDTNSPVYQQPVAFWTGAYAHVIGQDIPGGVAARSVVFGFPPVFFKPQEVKPGIEYILYNEWKLPRL